MTALAPVPFPLKLQFHLYVISSAMRCHLTHAPCRTGDVLEIILLSLVNSSVNYCKLFAEEKKTEYPTAGYFHLGGLLEAPNTNNHISNGMVFLSELSCVLKPSSCSRQLHNSVHFLYINKSPRDAGY